MSRLELFAPEGFRIDGRRWNEIRSLKCGVNTHPNSSDGSSFMEQGNTKVICIVRGPREPQLSSQNDVEKATIEVNLSIASFSTFERKKRTKNDKRIIEMKTTLQRTFEQCILLKLYPRSLIQVNLYVLAQDGGLLACLTNAVTLALMDAGIAMYDYVCAVSAGIHDVNPVLDLNGLEENDISNLTVGVVGKSEKLALLILEDRLPLDQLESVLAIGIAGGHRIYDLMDEEIRRHGNLRSHLKK